MAVSQPRYSKEEFARRGDELYERDLRPHVEAGNAGKFIVIDIETGAYEIDADELLASDRLLARHPDAQVWLRRIGSRYARRFGACARHGREILLKKSPCETDIERTLWVRSKRSLLRGTRGDVCDASFC